MSIDYYLAGRRHKRIFDIGDHKCSLHLYELCQQAAGDEKLRPKERFVATCVERFLALFREHQDWFDPGEGAQERWVKWAKKCAAAVVDFCEAEGWDVPRRQRLRRLALRPRGGPRDAMADHTLDLREGQRGRSDVPHSRGPAHDARPCLRKKP